MAFQHIVALIPAAGVGERMKADCPKQYLPIAGEATPTVLETCMASLNKVSSLTRLIVAVSSKDGYVDTLNLPHAEVFRTGGATRAETVRNTLQALAGDSLKSTLVLVHDAARPLVDPKDVEALIDAATHEVETAPENGAVLGIPVADTVKRVNGEGVITEDLSREGLVRIATPQAFRGDVLLKALTIHTDVTDESSAIRAAGGRVTVVPAYPPVFKLTPPPDPGLAAGLYRHHKVNPEGRKLIIGGVEIPHTLGLLGHSDADVLLHAVTDAVLGAAALGNIGLFFPDNDPKYKDADSRMLLAEAWKTVREKGWALVNLDAVLVAEKPKLNPHLPAMRASVAKILGVDVDQISIKPKTNEKLGFEGREEGVSAMVTVLLAKA